MVLVVQVRLLAGRYVATEADDRNEAEWPPHPARLYAAAVSAWAEADQPDADERDALRRWETLGPPPVPCSPAENVARRTSCRSTT